MNKRIAYLIIFIFTILVLGGSENKIESIEDKSRVQEEIQVNHQVHEKDIIRDQIDKMTLEEKIGQMVLFGFDGYTINEQSRNMIERYYIGGFILFKRNIKDSEQVLSLVNSLKTTNAINNVPLFIAVDEEGGRVTRMPKELKKFPSSKEIGEVDNIDLAFKVGNIIGEELKSFGFNMNFAPVLDINSNLQNSVIGNRSFGSTEMIVSKLGTQTMKGMQSQNIISVIKHFPGHGDTSIDSHLGLPSVNNDLDRLRSFELIPFSQAIKNNADAVMIAHILLPKIDSNNPATFSKTVITDILRNELNFNGIVITDDMEMGAISKNYNIEDASVESIIAGSDIVLVCHTYDKQVAVINGLITAVQNNIISEERIDESVYRILKLKQKYNLSNKSIESVNVKDLNEKINSIIETYLND